MEIIDKLRRVHEDNFAAITFDRVCAELLSNFGVDRNEDVPPWFHKLIDALLSFQTVTFFVDHQRPKQLDFLFEQMKWFCGWLVEDCGEMAQIDFPSYGMTLMIQREGAQLEFRLAPSDDFEMSIVMSKEK